MRMFIGKLAGAMFNPKVFLITQVYQAIVTPPAVRMDNTFNLHAASIISWRVNSWKSKNPHLK